MVTYLGSLVQLCYGERGTLQTNITGVCGECSQCMDHTGFAPAHGTCALLVYSAQVLGCSAGELCKVGLGFVNFPGSCILHKTQTQLGLGFVPFPGPSSSGDQVLGEHTVLGGLCITALVPTFGFLVVPPEHHLTCAVCLFWGADL